MGKKIIGIHGLANKPPHQQLENDWKKAILEGLRENCGIQAPDLQFRMVYWAKFLYKDPLHNDKNFDFDSLYNDEPYVAAKPGTLKKYEDSFRDKVKAGALDVIGDSVDFLKKHFGMDSLADWLLGRLLKDLNFYYDEERQIQNSSGQMKKVKEVLGDELKMVLREEKDHDIMLVSHSMGSIIAYDALRDLGRSDQGMEIPHFVTIGSPLGLPHVRGKIIQERTYDPKVRTPSIVTKSWKNFADRKDPVAADVFLKGDYKKNSRGVEVEDDLVANDYVGPGENGKPNHHKSYGYLRTPEFSEHLKSFLA